MSNESVSMRELELETAELLPSRETLNSCHYGHPTSSYSSTTSTFGQFGAGNNAGIGNVSVLNGSSVSVLSGNAVLSGNHTSIFGIL
jgi:hypothetical protein